METKFKKLAAVFALAGFTAGMSLTAQAGLVIKDAWKMNLPGFNGVDNIGHLVVSGGQSTVTQEVTADGAIVIGSKFKDFGGLFSISFTPENCLGACDSGAPGVLPATIQYTFSGLSGTVTGFDGNTGAVTYAFDAGVGSATLNIVGGPLGIATFTPQNPSGGSLANFFGAANTSGTSNLLFSLTTTTAGLFQDSASNNLGPGSTYFAIDTTNQIFTPASAPFACDDFGGGFCSTLVITQQGKIDALMQVPEPATLALLSLGILGMASVTRRRS